MHSDNLGIPIGTPRLMSSTVLMNSYSPKKESKYEMSDWSSAMNKYLKKDNLGYAHMHIYPKSSNH